MTKPQMMKGSCVNCGHAYYVWCGDASDAPVQAPPITNRDLTPEIERSIVQAMYKAWISGAPWAKGPKAGERYAVRRMHVDFGLPYDLAKETLARWERCCVVTDTLADRHTKMRGYKTLIA